MLERNGDRQVACVRLDRAIRQVGCGEAGAARRIYRDGSLPQAKSIAQQPGDRVLIVVLEGEVVNAPVKRDVVLVVPSDVGQKVGDLRQHARSAVKDADSLVRQGVGGDRRTVQGIDDHLPRDAGHVLGECLVVSAIGLLGGGGERHDLGIEAEAGHARLEGLAEEAPPCSRFTVLDRL